MVNLQLVLWTTTLSLAGVQCVTQLQCVACGLPKVDPNFDVFGSYGIGSGLKKYNHSCEEYETGKALDEAFIRKCPIGVQSCFFVSATYKDVDMNVRGCSESKYQHDYGCDDNLQPVNVIDQSGGTTRVNVDVNLCFCSDNVCNDKPAGASTLLLSRCLVLVHSVFLFATSRYWAF